MTKIYDIGIQCGWVVPLADGRMDVLENGFIGLRKEKIVSVHPFRPSDKARSRRFLSKKSMVALPGLINGHTHLPMTLLRGMAEDMALREWLFERILPLENAHVTKEFVRVGTDLAALECIRFGVTTVNDMYFFANEMLESLDRAGMRGIISQVFNSFETPEDLVLGGSHSARFLKLRKKYAGHPRLQVALGPHAPYSCGDEVLQECARLSENERALIHTHLCEAENEAADSVKKHSLRPVQRLQKLGILGPRTICAHAIHLNENEIQLLKETGTSVVYNPSSNAKLASGVAPVPKYLKAGVPVALGTDGSASSNNLSLFQAMDVGAKIQKLFNRDPRVFTAPDALRLATLMGAQALKMDKQIGSLEEEKYADLILVDFSYPHLQPVNDVVHHLVYSCQGLEVDTVICHGKILREGDRWYTMNPKKVFAEAEKFRKKIAATLSGKS